MTDTKKGGIRLQSFWDIFRKNPWKKALCGWKRTSQGFGWFNPMGWACKFVVLFKANEQGSLIPLYNQVTIPENRGGIVICEKDDSIAFIEQFRMIGPRLDSVNQGNYIAEINKKKKWHELYAGMGNVSWELPKGIPPAEETTDSLEAFIANIAKREAKEEAGLEIADVEIIGEVNPNPTFFLHAQAVIRSKVSAVRQAEHEDLEIIGKLHFLTRSQIREKVNQGLIVDGLSLSALALAGINF